MNPKELNNKDLESNIEKETAKLEEQLNSLENLLKEVNRRKLIKDDGFPVFGWGRQKQFWKDKEAILNTFRMDTDYGTVSNLIFPTEEAVDQSNTEPMN